MLQTNRLKYEACEHAREALLKSALTIVEAMGDPFWGTGLNVQQMKDCLIEYWPGQNKMRVVLMMVHDEYAQDNTDHDRVKRKELSLLANEPKQSRT